MVALDVCLYILSALGGLVVGSFLNVCIYRLPRGEFFSKSRSFCPNCKSPIKAYDNIPVLSYIILRGKCRSCGERISPRYPLVELLTCALWVGNYAAFGLDGMTIVYDITVAVLIVAAFVDLDTFEIPDSGIVTLLILGAVTFAPFGGVSWQDKLIGCVCVSVPMLIVCLFGGMGFGDVKLYFVLGLLLGWKKILVVFLLSVVLGAAVSVIYLVIKRRKAAADESIENSGEQDEECCSVDFSDAGRADDAKVVAVGEEREETFAEDKSEEGQASAVGEVSYVSDEDDDPLPKSKKGSVVPFGPFIALATVVTLYVGDALISIYARLLGL